MSNSAHLAFVYAQTASWRVYHQDLSNYVVWLDGKPWDSANSLHEVLTIFRLSEIDYVVSSVGQIFEPVDSGLALISDQESFAVGHKNTPVTLINTRSGSVTTTTSLNLCQMTHHRTLEDLQKSMRQAGVVGIHLIAG